MLMLTLLLPLLLLSIMRRWVIAEGISVALNDVTELVEVGSGSVPSGPNDVVGRGAWYAGEHLLLRAWGKLTVDVLLSIQQILSHATLPRPNGFPLGTYSIAGQASVGGITVSHHDKAEKRWHNIMGISLQPMASIL
ncbi:hypothetical protein Tco_1283956 [Tanacetum coccineum]